MTTDKPVQATIAEMLRRSRKVVRESRELPDRVRGGEPPRKPPAGGPSLDTPVARDGAADGEKLAS